MLNFIQIWIMEQNTLKTSNNEMNENNFLKNRSKKKVFVKKFIKS